MNPNEPQRNAGIFAALVAEHRDLESMLAGFTQTLALPPGPSRDEQLAVQARDLAELLRLHIRKEEAVVFRLADPPHEGCGRCEPKGDRP